MKYSRVFLEAIGYELAPIVVTSSELEEQLTPIYKTLHIPLGQLEALTGIIERRWWEPGYRLSDGAIAAARKALLKSAVQPDDLEVLIYAGVCREGFEPATACRVAHYVGVNPAAAVYDISNACLGVLNGILEIANRIELGQIRAGMVVSCETAREIMKTTIERMLQMRDMESFKLSLATLTGGSGAVAIILSDGSFNPNPRRRLIGGVMQTAPQFHDLCRWGVDTDPSTPWWQIMTTDSVAVLQNGVELGRRTWQAFLQELSWRPEQVDKVICHQVGSAHRDTILHALNLADDKDFSTHQYLGNIGTVSLPLTAGLAEDRDFLQPGDRVGFLGIGSGLNCLMLGWEW
ncbi:3-Oxoacyl-(Acyl-carrier-protein (ACP)) synthase III domain protein [Candidatus Vecturithrix granuli]|uniref:3-Oxoacyl-(Acyl-carrier-protein (ACP)) synthase III domain protein n=1 Tax=Vecturithrix granuli TaxID=1499967 RepID=A0A081C2P6_VECG1|nr:3-Oxoacyl-(Acyl-carrier-protein (ACP)) synthase III domain protein [Candidatus Vecturithrix granuli]